ncbi:lipid A-modifier LpxR family protein [Roseivirga echinicomitans]
MCLSLLFYFPVLGQSDYRRAEFSLTTENDVYLMNRDDEYYSNGFLFHYRYVPNKPDSLNNKEIIDIELTHKFYTPNDLLFDEISELDRPYAGLLYAGVSKSIFKRPQSRFKYGLVLGTTGKASGAEVLQKWYHNAVGFKQPRGWQHQIKTALVLNATAEYNRQFWLVPKSMAFISSSSVSLGTGHSNIAQNFDFRMGILNALNKSPFVNAMIGEKNQDLEKLGYVVFGYGVSYVLHDITVSGSLFNNDSPHTGRQMPWVSTFRAGWATGNEKTTFKIMYHWLSKDVQTARNDSYISFSFDFRLKSEN